MLKLMKCECCGAPLYADKCEYCGAVYKDDDDIYEISRDERGKIIFLRNGVEIEDDV